MPSYMYTKHEYQISFAYGICMWAPQSTKLLLQDQYDCQASTEHNTGVINGAELD